ncbi:MAG: PD40 domain-containing protein, partial [Isosphaeraceae bacterium]|nr:PD40 domain-containing protein [Isosphaeraceae bacterium]
GVDAGASVLLEESRGPLTAPGWHPRGTALAYGRLVPEGDERARFEIVVQDAPDRRRVLQSRTIEGDELPLQAPDLSTVAVAWSPDGHYLAVPQLQPPGLALIRADNGRLLKEIAGAFLPAWSPDGGRLAFYRTGEPEGLYLLEMATLGEPRRLLDLPEANPLPAPIWTPDGQALIVIRRLSVPGDPAKSNFDLVRIPIERARGIGKIEALKRSIFPNEQALRADEVLSGVSVSLHRSGEDLFATSWVEGRDYLITWFRPQSGEVRTHFNPVDRSVPIGALALAPGEGLLLALRAGPPGAPSPPALCEPKPMAESLNPLVPDDAARAEWVATLVNAARDLLRHQFPAATLDDAPVERASILPAPGEVPRDHPIL